MLYTLVVAKIKNNQWAGFNHLSTLVLQGDLEKELQNYGIEEIPNIEKGQLKIHEVEWNGFNVLIHYRRIN